MQTTSKRSTSRRPTGRQSKSNGFTLVEVMVALIIVAVSISALLVRMMANLDSTSYLRDTTVAHWVALNQLELLYIENQLTNKLIESRLSGSENMLTREWFWTIEPQKTTDPGARQVEISVHSEENDESALVTITGLIDNYHAIQ